MEIESSLKLKYISSIPLLYSQVIVKIGKNSTCLFVTYDQSEIKIFVLGWREPLYMIPVSKVLVLKLTQTKLYIGV